MTWLNKRVVFLNEFRNKENKLPNHHILHLSCGFILELAGHLKALANSNEFDIVPMTRNRGGEC